MGTRYPAGLVEWVKDNYLLMDTAELAAGCNERFGTNMNLKAMNSMKKRYGLKGGPRVKIYSDIFPKEVCEYILGNYKGIGPTEMAKDCSRIFGREYTAQQLKSFYKNKHINSGKTGRFEKGQKSWNKGKPMSQEQYAKCKATMFKKGNRPHNYLPVGSRVVRTDGYYQTKIAEPNVWKFSHVLIWEKEHGPVPEGYHISFKDSNPLNIDPSNLFLESYQEHLELNRRGYRSNIPQITETGLAITKLRIATKAKSDKRRKTEEV